MLGKPPQVPARFESIDSFQTLYAILLSLRDFLYAAANGDLSKQVSFKGYVAVVLKTLQANLRHLTWQAKMIASGDFAQRMGFMGEFSQAFNTMVLQLDQTFKNVARKEAELRQVNEDLVKEITVRKQTEVALRKSERAYKRLAIIDPLTGLYNRRHFNQLAETEIRRALRYKPPLSVIMLDIDFFKHVNDTFGHTIGDKVLKLVAKTIISGANIVAIKRAFAICLLLLCQLLFVQDFHEEETEKLSNFLPPPQYWHHFENDEKNPQGCRCGCPIRG